MGLFSKSYSAINPVCVSATLTQTFIWLQVTRREDGRVNHSLINPNNSIPACLCSPKEDQTKAALERAHTHFHGQHHNFSITFQGQTNATFP